MIFFWSQEVRRFFLVPGGWVIFFGPERLGDFFGPKRLGDFFLVPKGWLIFFWS